LELSALHGHTRAVAFVSKNIALSGAIFLFVAYLLGVLVRLFAPRYVDSLSKGYLLHIRRNKNTWVTDRFPYATSLKTRLEKDGMGDVLTMMNRLNPSFKEDNNTVFFNYCKLFIDANEPALSKQAQEAEALVRFLSGTTLALLIALAISIGLVVAFTIKHMLLYASLYSALLVSIIIGLLLILERFKYQRRREVILVWSCVYMIIKKGTPSSTSGNLKDCMQSVFFPTSDEQHSN
jgi:putative Mn2+ efflux pump MntP